MRNKQFFTIFAELNRRPADIAKFRLGPDVRAGAFFLPSIPRARMCTRWVSLARVRRACNPWRLCAVPRYFPALADFSQFGTLSRFRGGDCPTLRGDNANKAVFRACAYMRTTHAHESLHARGQDEGRQLHPAQRSASPPGRPTRDGTHGGNL